MKKCHVSTATMEGQSLRFSSTCCYRYPYSASSGYPYSTLQCTQVGYIAVSTPYFSSLPPYRCTAPVCYHTPSNTVPPYYTPLHQPYASGVYYNMPLPSSCTSHQIPRSTSPAPFMMSSYSMPYMPRTSQSFQQTLPSPPCTIHSHTYVRPHYNQFKTHTHAKKPSVISTSISSHSVAASDYSSQESSFSEAADSENESEENIGEGQMLIRGRITGFKSNGTEAVLVTGQSLQITIEQGLVYVNGKKVSSGKLLWDVLSLGAHLKAIIKERQLGGEVEEGTKEYTAVVAWFGEIPTLTGFIPTVRQLSEEQYLESSEEDSHEMKTYSSKIKKHLNNKLNVINDEKEKTSHIIGYVWWADKEKGILRIYDTKGWGPNFTGVLFTTSDLYFDGQQASCESLHLLIAHVNRCEVKARKVHPRVIFGMEVKWEAVYVNCGQLPSSLKSLFFYMTGSDTRDSSLLESLPGDNDAIAYNSDNDCIEDFSYNITDPLTKKNGGLEKNKSKCSWECSLESDHDKSVKENNDGRYEQECKRNKSKDHYIRKELKTKSVKKSKEFDDEKQQVPEEKQSIHHFHGRKNTERKSVLETLFNYKMIVSTQKEEENSLNDSLTNKNSEKVSTECLTGLLNDMSISDVTTDFVGEEYSGKYLVGHIVELFSAEEGFGMAKCLSMDFDHTFIKFKQDRMYFNCVPLNRVLYKPPYVYSKCCNLYVLPIKSEDYHDYSVRLFATCGWIGTRPDCVPSPGKQSQANLSLSHLCSNEKATMNVSQNCDNIKDVTKFEVKTSCKCMNDINSNCSDDFEQTLTKENNISKSHNIMSIPKIITCLNTSVNTILKEIEPRTTKICLASGSTVSENSTTSSKDYSVVSTNTYSTPSIDKSAMRSTSTCSTLPLKSSTPSSDISASTRIHACSASLVKSTSPDHTSAPIITSACNTSPTRSSTPLNELPLSREFFMTAMNDKQDLLTGNVIEVYLNMGKLKTEDGTQHYFCRDHCYLYGISLQHVELWHILVQGQQIQFRLGKTSTNRAKVTEVVIGSCHVDSSYKTAFFINEWCKNNAVPDVARNMLVEQLQ